MLVTHLLIHYNALSCAYCALSCDVLTLYIALHPLLSIFFITLSIDSFTLYDVPCDVPASMFMIVPSLISSIAVTNCGLIIIVSPYGVLVSLISFILDYYLLFNLSKSSFNLDMKLSSPSSPLTNQSIR